jgi:hypothetical protein
MPVAHKNPTTAGIEALNHLEPLRSKEYCITRNPSKLRGILKVLGLFASLNEILKILKVCLSLAFHWPFILFYIVERSSLRISRSDSEVMTPWQPASRCQYSHPDVTNQLKSNGKMMKHGEKHGKNGE